MQISLRKLSLVIVLQLGDIQSLWSFLVLWFPRRIDDDVEYADNQSIICLVVCSTHLYHSGMMSVFPLHYDIVNKMPMFGMRVHL